MHKFTEKRSESSTATIDAAAVAGIVVVTNVVTGIFAVVITAVDGIDIASPRPFVCVRGLIKRVMIAGNTGFNNSLLCKANDNEGVSPMCTDKETVKNKMRKVKKVDNSSLS